MALLEFEVETVQATAQIIARVFTRHVRIVYPNSAPQSCRQQAAMGPWRNGTKLLQNAYLLQPEEVVQAESTK